MSLKHYVQGGVAALCAFLCCLLPVVSTAEEAPEVTVIVNRMPAGTELYLSGTADTLLDVFDAPHHLIPVRDGVVDFGAFGQGTWDLGDGLLEGADIRIGSETAGFEAMSFMLHPQNAPMPFRTPLDGMIAIGVCGVLEPGARHALNALDAYAGYYAHGAAPEDALTLTLPGDGRTPVDVVLRVYGNGADAQVSRIRLDETRQTVSIPPAEKVSPGWVVGQVLTWAAALVSGVVWMFLEHRRADDASSGLNRS